MDILLLIYEFIKTGMFSIGGGLATLPFLYNMADHYPHWFSHELLLTMIAVSEATPGPIGIKTAAYAGFSAAGLPGSIAASLAIIVPGLIIMVFLVRALDRFKENRFVKSAFYGLRPAVTALIASFGLSLAIKTVSVKGVVLSDGIFQFFDWKELALFILLLLFARLYKKMQPVYLIFTAALAGVVFGL